MTLDHWPERKHSHTSIAGHTRARHMGVFTWWGSHRTCPVTGTINAAVPAHSAPAMGDITGPAASGGGRTPPLRSLTSAAGPGAAGGAGSELPGAEATGWRNRSPWGRSQRFLSAAAGKPRPTAPAPPGAGGRGCQGRRLTRVGSGHRAGQHAGSPDPVLQPRSPEPVRPGPTGRSAPAEHRPGPRAQTAPSPLGSVWAEAGRAAAGRAGPCTASGGYRRGGLRG